MTDSKPTPTKKEKKAAVAARDGRGETAAGEDAQGGTMLGYAVGAVLGVVMLYVLFVGTRTDSGGQREELAHVAIVAKFSSLDDAEVRKDVARLHRSLAELKEHLLGPLNAPIAVVEGGKLKGKNIDDLSEEEWARARPFMSAGSWLVPRLYNPELTAACYRMGPNSGGRFVAGTKTKLEKILKDFEGSTLKIQIYSHDLGNPFNDPQVRGEINAVFGVQTAHTVAFAGGGASFEDSKKVMDVYNATLTLKAADPEQRFRSITTLGNFWIYAMSVGRGEIIDDNTPVDENARKALDTLMEESRIPLLIDSSGQRLLIQATTPMEGKANLDACYYIAGNVHSGDFVVRVQR